MGKVLVIDDSTIARKIISDMLTSLNHKVIAEASDGEGIVDLYENNEVDFITIDMEMPKVDGITASKEILSKYSDAKIIMVTSIIDKKRTTIALNYGVNYILQKPITIEKLKSAISSLRGLNEC